jgi:hypothetical protein
MPAPLLLTDIVCHQSEAELTRLQAAGTARHATEAVPRAATVHS